MFENNLGAMANTRINTSLLWKGDGVRVCLVHSLSSNNLLLLCHFYGKICANGIYAVSLHKTMK